MKKSTIGIVFALLAALCYSLVNPINKLIGEDISPLLSSSMLYFGTFLVAVVIFVYQLIFHKRDGSQKLVKQDIPYLLLASLFHAGAAISLLFGLRYISASNASLLGSFEIISTSLFAYFIFKEKITAYLWVGIIFIFVACVTISLGDFNNLNFSLGTLLCLLSPICFGLANNFLKKISKKSPASIISFIGFVNGIITLAIALLIGERFTSIPATFIELGIGAVSYGVALVLFLLAERYVGAAKTSAFFSLAPFIAIILSLIIFQENPNYTFYIGLSLMAVGTIFASLDSFLAKKSRE